MAEEILEHIERLIRQRPVARAALEPYRDLMALLIREHPVSKPFELDDSYKEIKQEEGFPLFSRQELPLDLGTASGLLKKFFQHLKDTERPDKEGLKTAFEKSETEPQWCERLFRAILGQDENALSLLGKDVGLDPKALFFLGQTALRPSFETLREALSHKIEAEKWDNGYCPVCGSEPDISYFAKTGKRYLHCELCGQEWPYPRVKCVFCQNEDQSTLGYFLAEGEEGFRVDFCRKCKRYIKTLDKRALEQVAPMEIENLATLYLDMAAVEQGFK